MKLAWQQTHGCVVDLHSMLKMGTLVCCAPSLHGAARSPLGMAVLGQHYRQSGDPLSVSGICPASAMH